jgi:hypothetical protein
VRPPVYGTAKIRAASQEPGRAGRLATSGGEDPSLAAIAGVGNGDVSNRYTPDFTDWMALRGTAEGQLPQRSGAPQDLVHREMNRLPKLVKRFEAERPFRPQRPVVWGLLGAARVKN